MLKKILITGLLIAVAIGASGFGTASQWGVALPLSAVLFILCFIVTALEKEAALYDSEHQDEPGKAAHARPAKPVAGTTCQAF